MISVLMEFGKEELKQNSWARNKSGKWMYIDENGNISYARKLNINGVLIILMELETELLVVILV